MSDNLKIRRPLDAQKVNIHEGWEMDYWAKKFGISKAKLLAAVSAVGPSVGKITKYLLK